MAIIWGIDLSLLGLLLLFSATRLRYDAMQYRVSLVHASHDPDGFFLRAAASQKASIAISRQGELQYDDIY